MVTLKDIDGRTALHHAVLERNLAAITMLASKGVSLFSIFFASVEYHLVYNLLKNSFIYLGRHISISAAFELEISLFSLLETTRTARIS